MFRYLDTEGLKKLWAKIKNQLGLKQDTIPDLDDIRDGAALGKTSLQEHQDISGKADAAYVDELNTQIVANKEAIATLNGDDEGSVTKAVADGIAKVVADAPESFDTLKEISDWISSHKEDASAMNSQIQENKADIESLGNDKQDKLTAGDNIKIENNVISASGGVSGDYLPLSGGTLTGSLYFKNEYCGIIKVNDGGIFDYLNVGYIGTENGAMLILLRGEGLGGGFGLRAKDYEGNVCLLSGDADGTLTWNDKNILLEGDLAAVATSGDYADLTNAPTNVSAFTNDVGYLTEHQSLAGYVQSSDLATVATSGSYNDLTNTPTNVSTFANDVGYLTEHQDISGKADKGDLDDYLPLAGGTLTGTIYSSATNTLRYQGDYCSIYNNTLANGAGLLLRSKDSSTNAGGFELTARDGTNTQSLKGTSGGTLTWNGNEVATEEWVTDQGYSTTDTLPTITTSGSGNAVTAISISGSTITATKGSTFLTSVGTVIAAKGSATQPVYISSANTATVCTAYASAEVQMAKRLRVATCTTAAGTEAKVATCSGFTLATGVCIILYHTKRIYAGNTLNVNSTGAKTIMISGSTDSTYYSPAGSYLAICYYNGTNWILEGMDYGYTGVAAE